MTQEKRIEGHSEADLERLRSLTCAKWNWFDPDVLPAWVADMDLEPAPVVVEAIRALVERGDFGYNFAAASCLPQAWVDWQGRRHGWNPDVRKVRLFCDVMQAVEVALWLSTEAGDGIVVFTPIYPPFLGTVKRNRRRLVDVPLDPDGWRLDPERLTKAVDKRTKAILLCNPHNPTGRVFDREELLAIARLAEERDLMVISDEIWGDLALGDSRHIPFATLPGRAAKRSIVISAASKSFSLAGLRCAAAFLGDPELRKKIKQLPSHVLGAVGSPGAEASLAAWTKGEPWLDETRAFLTSQRDYLASRLSAELPEVGFTPPQGTYLAWLDLRAFSLGDDPAAVLVEKARVALSRGLDFGPRGAGFARLNFATTRPILDEILDRIIGALRL